MDWKAYRTGIDYTAGVERAGGVPVLLPVTEDGVYAKELLNRIDGLIIPGGPDVAPLLYGEEPLTHIGGTCQDNDNFELTLVRQARELGMPILGVCRGLQIINVAFGGTLFQHIPGDPATPICHAQDMKTRGERTHTVTIAPESLLAQVIGKSTITVNSFHHQAAKDVAPGFMASGHSKADGIIEAIESPDGILAVQWHPENLFRAHDDHAKLFAYLVDACKEKMGR